MPVFELRRLRLLHELAMRGTLAAVATALSYSPSTISQQLAQLEKDAGVPLLVPDGRRVRLTEQGEALAAHAARALALEEQIRGELEEIQPGAAPVRVAVMQTAALGLLPLALGILRDRAPGLRVELAELPPEDALFELAARGFDLVIAEQYAGVAREHRSDLQRETLGRDPIRLALPLGTESVARGGGPAALAALRDLAWVLEPVGTASRQWAVQQCRAAGFEPDVRFELADLTAHVRLIAAGHAVGFLPDLLWAGEEPRVRLVGLPEASDREIFTAVRRSSTSRAGIRIVREALHAAFDLHAGSADIVP